MSSLVSESFLFGIYPGGVAGMEGELGMATGRVDNPNAISQALDRLQGNKSLFIIRDYLHYKGGNRVDPVHEAVHHPHQYCGPSRKLDLVLCFQATSYSVYDWQQFIGRVFDYYGPVLHSLQIAEEPNLYHFPGDGLFPKISQVIVDGIRIAKQEILKRALPVQVGFNAVPCFKDDDPFWNALRPLVNPTFLESLDYVGLDFFPDVFRPLPSDGQAGDLHESVKGLLQHFRHVNLKTAGIDQTIPIRITEHGWPTGPNRSHERQVEILETVIKSVYEARHELNITHYELFSLRDADSTNPNLFYQFGLLRDDYSAKPAFYAYQKLIEELT